MGKKTHTQQQQQQQQQQKVINPKNFGSTKIWGKKTKIKN